MIDTSWYLFDPTWGSGYVNGGKFYKKINNAYYKQKQIKSHTPFDNLWEKLNNDSIAAYQQLSHIDQVKATQRRIEQVPVRNAMVFDRLAHLKVEIENDRIQKENERSTRIANLYNSAAKDYNIAVNDYNAFINYRNNQFNPMKTDPEIQAMLDEPEMRFKRANTKLDSITNPDANMVELIAGLKKGINDVTPSMNEQKEWLQQYFSKSKSKRKGMFYKVKYTWFGIPLN